MNQITLALILTLCILSCSTTYAQQRKAQFPKDFSAHIKAHSFRDYEFDLYYNSEKQIYRFDSYGVPLSFLNMAGLPELEGKQGLYLFFLNYSEHKMYALYPTIEGQTEEKWLCVATSLGMSNMPLLFNNSVITEAEFLRQEETPTGIIVNHYQRNLLFFTLEYYTLAKNNDMPYSLSVASDYFVFSDFTIGTPSDDVFIMPVDKRECMSGISKEAQVLLRG